MHSSLLAHALGAVAMLVLGSQTAVSGSTLHQEPGSISGRVQDPEGNPLSSVRVLVSEIGRSTTTRADGTFAFAGLRAGTYHLDATLIGYAPAHVEVTIPDHGESTPVTLTLRVTPLALPSLHVTGSVVAEDPLRVTQSTVQLAGKELARNLGATVAQTLARQPGIATRYAGPAAAVPVIRGFTGERILVLHDGQRSGDLSSTSSDHALSIDPLAASEIEVVRGPASLLYGNNALGGVVNVITNDIPTAIPPRLQASIAAQAESVNPGGALSGSAILPISPSVAVAIRGGWRNIDDVRTGEGGRLDNTGLRSLHGTAGIVYIGQDLSAGAAYRGYGFDYGLPAPPDAEESGVRIEGARHEVTARGDISIGAGVVTRLRVHGTAQWYRHDEVEPEGEIGTTFDLRTQTLNLLAQTSLGSVRGAIGASALFKQYAPTGEEALTPAANSSNGGVLVFQDVRLGDSPSDLAPRLQVGARLDLYRIEAETTPEFGPARTRDFESFSGSLGLNVPITHAVAASVSLARAFRAPTVEELFSNGFHAAVGSFDIGNPELDAETNRGIEAVLRAQSIAVTAQAAAYYNWIDNYIAPEIVGDTLLTDGGNTFLVPLNVFRQDDAAVRGLEAQIEATVSDQIVVGAMGDLTRGSFRDGSPLPFMPTARLGGSIRWDNSRYSAGAEARHAWGQSDVPQNEFATDDYTLIDLTAGATLMDSGRIHSVTLRADNVFDVLYREPTSRIKDFAPNPGRNVALVYRIAF